MPAEDLPAPADNAVDNVVEDGADERAAWIERAAGELARVAGPAPDPCLVHYPDARLAVVFGALADEHLGACYDVVTAMPQGAVLLVEPGRAPRALLDRAMPAGVLPLLLQTLADDAPEPQRRLCVEGAARLLAAAAQLPAALLPTALALADDLRARGALSDREAGAVVKFADDDFRGLHVRGAAGVAVAVAGLLAEGGRVAKVVAPAAGGSAEAEAAAPGVPANELRAFADNFARP